MKLISTLLLFVIDISITLISTNASAGSNPTYRDTTATTRACPAPLHFQNPSLISGSDRRAGATYRFSNITNGVDGLVKILSISNASIGAIDDNGGYAKAFQPELMQNNGSRGIPDQHVDFEISFVNAGTRSPKTLASVQASAVDVDGDWGGTREYTILPNADYYLYENPTNLTSPSAGRFTPISTKQLPGININDTEAMVSAVYTNVSSIRYTTGFTSDGSDYKSYHRQSSLSFECVTYNNPPTPPPPPITTGHISGIVYSDIDGNNSYNSGWWSSEPTIPSVKVSLYNDKGTASTADDTLLRVTNSGLGGGYSFLTLSQTLTYRIEVDTADTDLPAGSLIGTTNPLTRVRVVAEQTTTNQNFGFDPQTVSLSPTFNCSSKTKITWGNNRPDTKHWVAIYPRSEANLSNHGGRWKYLNDTKIEPTTTTESGVITIPDDLNSGQYKAYIFSDQSRNILSGPIDFTVTSCAEAFTCSSSLYLSSNLDLNVNNEMGLHKVNRTSNPYTLDMIGNKHSQAYNAIAYRLQDDYIYATHQNTLLKIGSNGLVEALGNIIGLPANKQYYAGTTDNDGFYYISGLKPTKSNKVYKIDVTATPPRVISTINLSRSLYIWDFTYINGHLYGVEATSLTETGKLIKISMSGIITDIGQPLSGYEFGSAFSDNTGSFFAIDDTGKGFFKIDINTGIPVKLSEGTPSRLSDGANCATATISSEQPDLSLKKRLAIGQSHTINPNDTITFTLDITNEGPTDVHTIELIDYIPGAISLNDTDWSSYDNGSKATLNTPIPTLAAGDTTSVDISFIANANVVTRSSQTRIGGVLVPEEEGCKNAAEIKAFLGGTDSDSTPDSTPDNDHSEDDYDVANINVEGVCSGIFDYGDAPDTTEGSGKGNYQTQFNDNGAKHSISELLYLGNCVDTDDGDLQNTLADADDSNPTSNKTIGICSTAGDDEDGLTPPVLADNLVAPSFNVKVFNNTGNDATLFCWADYNGDGVFNNSNERGEVNVSSSSSTQSVSLTLPDVPSTAGFDTEGNTYLRCRIASGDGASNSVGSAANGEVEDYPVIISTRCTVNANTTNIQCDDQGTSSPTDDTWSFDTLVNAVDVPSTDWVISGNHSANGSYGQNTVVSVGLITAKPELNVQISDTLDSTCKTVKQITAPSNCSSNCGLFLDQGNISIDDKGTDTATDDDLNVEIIISGVNPANTTWEASRKVGANTYNTIATGSGSQTRTVTVKVSDIISNDPNGFTLRVKQDNNDCSVEVYINLPNINTLEVNKTVVGDTAPANWEFTLASSNCSLPVGLTNPANVSGNGGNTSFSNLEIYDATGQSCLYELSENTQTGYALDSTASDDLTNIVLTEDSTKVVNIVNDQQAYLFVDDASVVEGDSGTVNLNFPIIRSSSSTRNSAKSASTTRAGNSCSTKNVNESFNNDVTQTWTAVNLTNTTCSWSVSGNKLKELSSSTTACKGFLNHPVDASKYNIDSDTYNLRVTIDSNYQNSISNYPKDNNGVGIVFGYQDQDNYYLARWLDYGDIYEGNNSYHYRHLQLIKQDNGSEILIGEKYLDLPEQFEMKVDVSEAGIKLSIDNQIELQASSRPILNAFGLYTIDNDDGIYYDNFKAHTECPSDENTSINIDVSTNFAITAGTADVGVDYQTVANGTVTIPAGATSINVTVPVIGDTNVEADETFTIHLSESELGIIVDGDATGTIIDDDVIIPSMSIADNSTTEGNSGTKNLDFTVTLSSPAPSGGSSITYTSSNGTATTANNDYDTATRILTIAEADTTGTISVVINGDTNVEPDETFILSLSNHSNATLADNQATGTIINDDSNVVSNCAQIVAVDQTTLFPQNQAHCVTIPRTTPTPKISIADNSITEGNSGTSDLNFTVTLDKVAPSGGTQVTYSTANDAAVSNTDYQSNSNTLTIPAGSTSGTISITINGDTIIEPDETFLLNLSTPTNGVIADTQAIGTIINDDFGANCNAGSGDFGGTIFQDYNANGTQDITDTGVANVTVTAYDSSNSLASTAPSNNNGSYVLSGLNNGSQYRIEFSDLPTGSEATTSTILFATAGASCSADLGLSEPINYCQATPDLVTTRQVNGDSQKAGTAASIGTLVRFPYSAKDKASQSENIYLGTNAETGAVWGMAFQKKNNATFTSAFLKRHVGFGSLGTGGIYTADPSTNTTTPWVDVRTIGIPTGDDTRDASAANTLPANARSANYDAATFTEAGKRSIGDIDIDDATNTMWLINTQDRSLYGIQNVNPANTPTASDVIGGYPVEHAGINCNKGILRPWAININNDKIYVGAVCSGESSATANTNDLVAHILSFDPTTELFTPIFNFPLNWDRQFTTWAPDTNDTWHTWYEADHASNFHIADNHGLPTPILSDIEFDTDGSMIIAFMDRFSLMRGPANYLPDPSATSTTLLSDDVQAYGDVIRVCNLDSGYVLEGNTLCPSNSRPIGEPANIQAQLHGPSGGEYYSGDYGPQDEDGFSETINGGLALFPGKNEILATATDANNYDASGVIWLDNTNGERTGGYDVVEQAGVGNPQFFNKAGGIGDIELLCDDAPIVVGNRVWADINDNGIQDAGEYGIPNTAVSLNCGADSASTTTNNYGEYSFSNITGGNASFIDVAENCTLSIDTTQTSLSGGSLSNINIGGDTSNNAKTDVLDSDASSNGNTVEINFTAGDTHQNNHSLDFGFAKITVTPPKLIDPRLIAHWVFDEALGTSVKDITGNGHTGTLSGNPTWVAGKSGTALLFDDNAEHMDTPSSADFSPPDFTIAMWVKWPNGMASGWHALLEYSRKTRDKKWYGVMTNSDMLRFLRPDPLDEVITTTTTDWYHIAVSIDSTGNKKMYLSGVEIDSSNNGEAIETIASVLRIGSNLDGAETANAIIDDVRFYNDSLTQAEIQTIIDDSNDNCTDALITESFDSNLSNWTVNKFNNNGCGWSVESSRLKEKSGSCNSFLEYDNATTPHNTSSGNYTLSVDVDANLSVAGNNGVGFVFGYEDDLNYYQIRWYDFSTNYSGNTKYRYLQLTRRILGVNTKLDEKFVALPSNFNLKVKVTPTGTHVYIDDLITLSSASHTPLLKSFGLYAYDNDGGIFYDNLKVDTCGTPEVSLPIPPAVAEYRFDECSWRGTAQEVKNSASDDLHGTGHSGVFNTRHGKLYRGGKFDGLNDFIQIENDAKLQLSADMSLSLWINPDELVGRQGLIFKNDDYEYEMILHNSGRVDFYHGDGSYEEIQEPAAATIDANTWSHIVITRDHATKNLKWYINGILKGEDIYIKNPAKGSDVIKIGQRGNAESFKGRIDEVKFFNTSLSSDEIQSIYNNEGTGKNYDGTSRTPPTCTVSVPARNIAANTVETNNDGTLTWRSVWVNQGVADAPYVEITAEIPNGTRFIQMQAAEFVSSDGVYCEARGLSADQGSCSYEAPSEEFPQGRVVWKGLIAAEDDTHSTSPRLRTATTAETRGAISTLEIFAENEIVLRFNTLPTGSESIITGQVYSDWYFDGISDSTIDLRVNASNPDAIADDTATSIIINKTDYVTNNIITNIPTVSEWGIILLSLLIMLIGLTAARRRF